MIEINEQFEEYTFCILKMDVEKDLVKCFIDKQVSRFIGHILIENSVPQTLTDSPFFDKENATYADIFGENIADIMATKTEFKSKSHIVKIVSFKETAR